MTATKGLGITGNGVGVTTPLDMKLAQSGLIVKTSGNAIRPGLFWGGNANIIAGTAGMAYSVIAYTCAMSRGATAGTVLGANDGTIASVGTTAAPGSNSRYDVIYHWPREYTIDGVDSNPVIAVIQGTAAAVPTVPSLAAFPGAIELGRVLVPAGVTATNSGTTITQTAQFTAIDGGKIPVRNSTELTALTGFPTDQRALKLDTMIEYRFDGSTWKAWTSDWITYVPTTTNLTLGSGTLTGKYRYVSGRVQVEGSFVLGAGSAVGTSPTFTNPVAADAFSIAQGYPMGDARFGDAGVALSFGFVAPVNSTVSQPFANNTAGAYAIALTPSATVPFAFGSGDGIYWRYEYTPA